MTASTTLFDLEVHLGPPSLAGALHLYPLIKRGTADAKAGPGYLPGPLAADTLEVAEVGGGSVPDLDVVNHAAVPLLLVEGETLVGGLQNRTLNVSVLLPVGASTKVPVSCVEAGRWGDHRAASRSARHSPPRLRARKTESVNRSVRRAGLRHSDQSGVWADVDGYADSYEVVSESRALEDVHGMVAPRVEALVGDLNPSVDQIGAVVAVAGRPVILELFDHPETLAVYWPGLVRGYALDSLPEDAESAAQPAQALRFLRQVAACHHEFADGVGLGEELRLESDTITGAGLRWEHRLRHLAAFRKVPVAGAGSAW